MLMAPKKARWRGCVKWQPDLVHALPSHQDCVGVLDPESDPPRGCGLGGDRMRLDLEVVRMG
jgi:hypothetical protein